MKASRRKFLKTGSMAAMASGVPLGLLAAPGRMGLGRAPQDLFSLATFAPFLNSRFAVRTKLNQVQATLIDAQDLTLAQGVPEPQGECFALRFSVPRHLEFPQGIYTLDHGRLGQLSLFLAPVGRPSQSITYEAIINRTLG